MNWLAHLHLSDADPEHRLGNLLADMIKGKKRKSLSPRMRQGIRCHQIIDAFTDYHPLVHKSKAHITGSRRRYAGILIDIFYDHFLARHWERYSDVPFEFFTAEIYDALNSFMENLPGELQAALGRIIENDLFGSYRTVEGIDNVLRRMSRRLTIRWRRPCALEDSMADFLGCYNQMASEFAEFFPQLCAHTEDWKRRST